MLCAGPEPRLPLRREVWIDWVGQMCASLFWVLSVVTRGRYDLHDVLQLLAAVSWLVAVGGRTDFLRSYSQAPTTGRYETPPAVVEPVARRADGGAEARAARAPRVSFAL